MATESTKCANTCQQGDTLRRIDVSLARLEEHTAALPDAIALAVMRHADSCRSDRVREQDHARRQRTGSDPAIPIPKASWARIWQAVAALCAAIAAWAGIRLLG